MRTIDAAYEALNLRPAVDFEQEVLALKTDPVRCIGTTTRMLVHIALDLRDGHRVYLRAYEKRAALSLRAQAIRYAFLLGASYANANQLVCDVTPMEVTAPFVRRYQDHYRDARQVQDLRVKGPLGWACLARWQAHSRCWILFDRDQQQIGIVTSAGVDTLRQRHFMTITEATT